MAKVVVMQKCEFISGNLRNAGMVYGITTGRYQNPFLLSSLPAFLRGSGAMVVEAILFGCGYAVLRHIRHAHSVAAIMLGAVEGTFS